MRTEMNFLVIGSWLFYKEEQPELKEKKDWRKDYVLGLRPKRR